MRVLHVITRLIVGGAQENTLASVLGLHRRPDVEVALVSGPTTGPEGTLEPVARQVPGLLTVLPSLVRPVAPWQDLRAWCELTRRFRQQRPDIVHTHSGKAGVVGRLAAHRAGVPVIVHTIHGPSFGPFQSATANLIFKNAERVAARHTTHFVSVADAMTRQYLDAGIGTPEQFSTVWSGFDLRPFLAATNDPAVRARYGLLPEDIVVGKIARLFENKGHEDLLATAPGIVKAEPRVRFLLVGDGTRRAWLEQEIQRLGLGAHFVFTGLVPPAKIPELVGIMDLLVHLSRREGLARALPQALAAGRPVVAYDCDGAREVCLDGTTGHLVALGDHAALRERVLGLAQDPARRARYGEAGRALVRERFTVERMVEALYQLYRRLLTVAPGAATPSSRSATA